MSAFVSVSLRNLRSSIACQHLRTAPLPLQRLHLHGSSCRRCTVCSTADSYIDLAIQGTGSVAEMAVSRKEAKYAALQTHHIFQPFAVVTLGPIN